MGVLVAGIAISSGGSGSNSDQTGGGVVIISPLP